MTQKKKTSNRDEEKTKLRRCSFQDLTKLAELKKYAHLADFLRQSPHDLRLLGDVRDGRFAGVRMTSENRFLDNLKIVRRLHLVLIKLGASLAASQG